MSNKDIEQEKAFLKQLVDDGLVDTVMFIDEDGDIDEVYRKKFDS